MIKLKENMKSTFITNFEYKREISLFVKFLFFFQIAVMSAQQTVMPEILSDKKVMEKHLLPDFSYAGYHFGEKNTPSSFNHILNITDFGAVANDGNDDSKALIAALEKANSLEGYVLVNFPSGTFNISEIIYINRSKTILRGMGAGEGGTVLYFKRPLRFVADPPEHVELKEYITHFNKRQINSKDGLDVPFSQYSWSGAFLWVAKKGKLYKSYNIPQFNQPINTYTDAVSGKQGELEIKVKDASKLEVGQTYKLCWYNKDGAEGSLIKHIYNNQKVVVGAHHYDNPENPLLFQMVMISKIEKNTLYIKAPLLHDVKPEWFCSIVEWDHIEEVGIENFSFEFPMSNDFPHHCEDGYNAIYLTSLMNGWVKNVQIKNADSGILTDDISNVTIENITTYGDKSAHYSVAMGEVHNVLIKDLRVKNKVQHPISFNTRSTRCVYTNCEIEKDPLFDQHSAMNEQNLFDKIKVYIDAPVHKTFKYRLFSMGGEAAWAPGHAAFNTFYNIEVNFANIPVDSNKPIELYSTQNSVGASVRLIGVHANYPVTIKYEINPYIEKTNALLSISSLYEYQLNNRLFKTKK